MHDPIDHLRRYARDLEREVGRERARLQVNRILARPATRPRRFRPVVVAVGIAGLMLLSNVALAAVANPSAPGDPLYGIDRAYERIIGSRQSQALERLDEAKVLAERGRAADALALVREALASLAAADSLEEARSRLEEMVEQSGVDRSELAEWLDDVKEAAREAGDEGPQNGEGGVADVARGGPLGGEEVQGPGQGGGQGAAGSGTTPSGNSLPEQAGGGPQGPPEHAGGQGEPGPPDNPGSQGNRP